MSREQSVFTTSVLSGATASSGLDLQRSWGNVYLIIQSMTSNSQLHIQASDAIDGTYRRVRYPIITTSSVQSNDFVIGSSVSSAIIPIPAGIRYMKVEQTATADGGQTYKVIVGD